MELGRDVCCFASYTEWDADWSMWHLNSTRGCVWVDATILSFVVVAWWVIR